MADEYDPSSDLDPNLKITTDANGNLYRVHPISEEDMHDFEALLADGRFKKYQKFLAQQRNNTLFNLMSEKDTESVLKRIGKAEGLHLAATALDFEIRNYKQIRARRVAAESKKQPQGQGNAPEGTI